MKSITKRAQACLPGNVLGQRSNINDCLFKLSIPSRPEVGSGRNDFCINDPALFS